MTHFTFHTRAGRASVLAAVMVAGFLLTDRATGVSAQGFNRGRSALTGTYQLNPGASDNAVTVADQITRSLPGNDRPRLRQVIMRRLEAPESLALERRGRTITMASSNADRVTFEADGRVQTEPARNGGTIRTVATLYGDRLQITNDGDRSLDYQVTFEPINAGRSLRVTRRVSDERLPQPVTSRAVYDRVSDVAELDMFDRFRDRPARFREDVGRNDQGNFGDDFAVAPGSEIIATLDNTVSTRDGRNEQPFTLTVQSPAQFQGAQIDGVVFNANRSGRVTGHSDMSFDFSRMRTRGGRSFPFEAALDTVRTPDGDTLRIENAGTVREDSQGERTATRTGVGAAIGAVIGAIAGGGKGAAIGGALGAGAGAGSVIAQGRDELTLPAGTEFRLRALEPR